MTAPSRGEIWTVDFDPSVGAEIQKTRPAAVISVTSVGRLPLRIVVPITDWKAVYTTFHWFVFIPMTPQNRLAKDSGADAFQVKSLAISRFVNPSGILTDDELDKIVAAVKLCIGGTAP